MTTILGIDLSLTGTGLALLYDKNHPFTDLGGYPNATFHGQMDNRAWTTMISTSASDSMIERWREITGVVVAWASYADLVVIEGYAFARHQVRNCIELGGIVRYLLAMDSTTVLEINPTVLKKFVTASGNAEKSQMLLQTYKRWGVEFSNDNECDAYGLAKIGQAIMLGTDGLTQHQVEIIEKLKAAPKPKKKKRRTDGE